MSTEIRATRERLGLSQQTFWNALGVTQSGGSRYETGRRIPKTVQTLIDLVYSPYPAARKLLGQLRRVN